MKKCEDGRLIAIYEKEKMEKIAIAEQRDESRSENNDELKNRN